MRPPISDVANVLQITILELKLTSTLWSEVLEGEENLSVPWNPEGKKD